MNIFQNVLKEIYSYTLYCVILDTHITVWFALMESKLDRFPSMPLFFCLCNVKLFLRTYQFLVCILKIWFDFAVKVEFSYRLSRFGKSLDTRSNWRIEVAKYTITLSGR